MVLLHLSSRLSLKIANHFQNIQILCLFSLAFVLQLIAAQLLMSCLYRLQPSFQAVRCSESGPLILVQFWGRWERLLSLCLSLLSWLAGMPSLLLCLQSSMFMINSRGLLPGSYGCDRFVKKDYSGIRKKINRLFQFVFRWSSCYTSNSLL